MAWEQLYGSAARSAQLAGLEPSRAAEPAGRGAGGQASAGISQVLQVICGVWQVAQHACHAQKQHVTPSAGHA